MTAPRPGDVWFVDLGMAAKVRPALVIGIPAEEAERHNADCSEEAPC